MKWLGAGYEGRAQGNRFVISSWRRRRKFAKLLLGFGSSYVN